MSLSVRMSVLGYLAWALLDLAGQAVQLLIFPLRRAEIRRRMEALVRTASGTPLSDRE